MKRKTKRPTPLSVGEKRMLSKILTKARAFKAFYGGKKSNVRAR